MTDKSEIQSREKKKMNIGVERSVDELRVQFHLLQTQMKDNIGQFVDSTDSALERMRNTGDSKKEFSKNFESLRRTVKKSAKALEKSLEDLIDEWKKEVRADIKDPKRYDSKH